MFWYILATIVLFLVLWGIVSNKKREDRLSSVSPEVRKRFERYEKHLAHQAEIKRQAAEKKREIELDDIAAEPATTVVEVALAEGRKYARVWVPPEDVGRVKRWAARHGYRAISVKTGNSGDVQLSISNLQAKNN